MSTIYRVILFLVGIVILIIYFSFGLYKLGVFFWFIPVFGLGFMGVNLFGTTISNDAPVPNSEIKKEIKNTELRKNQNLIKSNFTTLENTPNNIRALQDFIDETTHFMSLVFYYGTEKQIVQKLQLENQRLNTYSYTENRIKNFDIIEIESIKRTNYHYYWHQVKCSQNDTT